MSTTIVSKRGKNFVVESISESMKLDYDRYLMGQVTMLAVCDKHEETIHRVTRIFNKLYHEKMMVAKISKQ